MKGGIREEIDSAWDEIKQGKNNKHHYQNALNILNRVNVTHLSLQLKKNYYLARARGFEGQSNYTQALQELENIPKTSWDETIHRCRGSIFRKQGKDQEASEAFDKTDWQFSPLDKVFDVLRGGNYLKALAILENIEFAQLSGSEKRDYHLVKSKILQEQGEFAEALAELNKIPFKWRNRATEISRAICVERQGNLKQARTVLKSISNAKSDPKVITALNVLRDKKGKSRKTVSAVEKLIDFDNITQADTENLLILSRARENMGDFNGARETIELIKGWRTNKKAVLSLARIYAMMGKYPDAEKTIKEWQGWDEDKDTLIILARFSEETDRFKSAVRYLKLIENWEGDRVALLALGRCYQSWHKITKAETYFKKIEGWEEDREVLLSFAYNREIQGFYEEAIVYFQKIKNWQQNLHACLGIIRCHQACNDPDVANKYQNLVKVFPNSPQAALSEIVYLESLSLENSFIKDYYHKLIKKFPTYLPAYFNYCRYLVEHKDPKAKRHLENALKKFPYAAGFYLLKAKMYRENDDLESCLNILTSSSQQFPFHVATYLELIRHYLLNNDRKNSVKISKNCLERFPENKRLTQRINKLFETIPFIRMGGYHDLAMIDEMEEPATDSHCIQEGFQIFRDLPGKTYLVGSGVISLISGCQIPVYDLDFVNSSIDSVKSLIAKDFVENRYVSHAYKKFFGSLAIDMLVVDASSNEAMQSLALSYHALKRDYTICTLMSDGKTITDPTGMGVLDAKQKRLRMVGHAKLRFIEDPSLLIRGIYYMALGYHPVPELDLAMKQFNAKITSHQGLIEDLTRKYLCRTNATQFVELLIKYRLYEKLFPLPVQATVVGSELALREYLGVSDVMVTQPINMPAVPIAENEDNPASDELDKKGSISQVKDIPQSDKQENEQAILRDQLESLSKNEVDEVDVVAEKIKSWSPLADVAKKASKPIVKDDDVAPMKTSKKNSTPRRRNLAVKKAFSQTHAKKVNINSIIEKVIHSIVREESYDICPAELKTAKDTMRNVFKQKYAHLLIEENKKRLEDIVFSLLSSGIYRKEAYQLLLFWKGCHQHGVRLNPETHCDQAISEARIKLLVGNEFKKQNRKRKQQL